MARRLKQTPELLQTYSNIITEYESRGFIEKVQTTQHSDKAHYISHHPVKKESSTTPIRIVFDCSCRQYPDLPSLNDCLEVGRTIISERPLWHYSTISRISLWILNRYRESIPTCWPKRK